MPKEVRKLNLEQFKAVKIPADVQGILGKLNAGNLMCCHKLVFEATGIWIPELVPIFQKLDAMVVTQDLPASLR